jgi:signal transduction histidine kinase
MTEASESHDSSRQSDRQDWSEGPRLELDQLLAQLVAERRMSWRHRAGCVDCWPRTVRAKVLEVVAQITALLPFEPDVRFIGPIDAVVADAVIDDLVAVTREALTNIARHAHATQAVLTLTAGPASLILEVIDDGDGMGNTDRRSGLDNLRHRAENHGGTLVITSAASTQRGWPREGTHLRWSIPLPN